MSKKLSDAYKEGAAVVAPVDPPAPVYAEVSLTDITLPPDCHIDHEEVERLKVSLTGTPEMEGRLLQPITIDQNGEVVCGVHRYTAYEELGRAAIPSVRRHFTPDEKALARLHENTMRRNLTLKERIDGTELLKRLFVNPSSNLRMAQKDPDKKGVHLEDLAVEHGLFDSVGAFHQGQVAYKMCIPEVIKAYDDRKISLYRAYKFADVPKKRQMSLLTRMLDKRTKEGGAVEKPTRIAAQKVRTTSAASKYDFPTDDMDKYEVVHVAPDWNAPNALKNTKALPISQYIFSDAVVFLDCPARMFGLALEVLDYWKFHYWGFFMIDHAKYTGPVLDYVLREPLCVVIGIADKMMPLQCDSNKRIAPYHIADDPRAYAVKVLTDYFGGYMRGCMLDMTSTVPVDGWDVLEIKFRKPK